MARVTKYVMVSGDEPCIFDGMSSLVSARDDILMASFGPAP
jgi:hypothetical protein